MNEIKNLTKSTIIYFLGTVGTKLVSFLLLPVYTAYILPDSYGIYDLNISFATLFASFFFLDIWTGIMKFIFEYKDEKQKREVVYNGLSIFLGSSLLYLATMGGYGLWTGMEYLPGVIAYGFFMCLQSLYGYLARSFGYNTWYALSGIVSTFSTALINIILLVVLGWDYQALYLAYAIGILIQCLMLERKVNVFSLMKRTYYSSEKKRELLKFSLPLCINSVCYWLLTGYNRIVIQKYLGDAVNGYFAVASKFGGILLIVSSCLSMAWQELAYRKFDKDSETGRFYSSATNLYIKGLFCGFMVLMPIIYIIFPWLIGNSYLQAKELIPINMLATLAGIMFVFLGNIISTYKRNETVFLSTLAACIVNILCLHLFIQKLGVHAANLALLLGYIASNGIRIYIIGKEIPYHLNYKAFFYLIPLTMVICYVYLQRGIVENILMFVASSLISVYLLFPILKRLPGSFMKL